MFHPEMILALVDLQLYIQVKLDERRSTNPSFVKKDLGHLKNFFMESYMWWYVLARYKLI